LPTWAWAPVGRVDHRGTGTGAPLELLFDGLGNNTLAAVNGETGTVNASFNYAPFGEVIEATDGGGSTAGVAVHQRRFNDKYQDAISGLTYYGFRYYDKLSMSWTQSDPLYRFVPDAAWLQPRKAGLYVANLNNPLRYIDPDGRDPKAAAAAARFGMGLVANAPPHPIAKGIALAASAALVAAALVTPDLGKVKEAFDEVAEFGIGPSERHENWTHWDKRAIEKNRAQKPNWTSNMMNEAKAKAAAEADSNASQSGDRKRGPGNVADENGVRIDIYSADHGPPHAHVKSGDRNTRVGQNGKPLKGEGELTATEKEVVENNKKELRNRVRDTMKEHKKNKQ